MVPNRMPKIGGMGMIGLLVCGGIMTSESVWIGYGILAAWKV